MCGWPPDSAPKMWKSKLDHPRSRGSSLRRLSCRGGPSPTNAAPAALLPESHSESSGCATEDQNAVRTGGFWLPTYHWLVVFHWELFFFFFNVQNIFFMFQPLTRNFKIWQLYFLTGLRDHQPDQIGNWVSWDQKSPMCTHFVLTSPCAGDEVWPSA